jgi:hypothetical protein
MTKILVIMNTWDNKLCNRLDKWQKTINCKKTPCDMYSRIDNCILLMIEGIFHSLTSHKVCNDIYDYLKYWVALEK